MIYPNNKQVWFRRLSETFSLATMDTESDNILGATPALFSSVNSAA